MAIVDRYFNAGAPTRTKVWPLPALVVAQNRLAAASLVFLIVINQIEVALDVRLSYFRADFTNALKNSDQGEFWRQLLFVFTPVVAVLVASLHCRIRRHVDLRRPLAAMADRRLHGAMAASRRALQDGARRRGHRQSGSAHIAGHLFVHRRHRRHRRRRRALQLFRRRAAEPDVAGLLRDRAVVAVGRGHAAGHGASHSRGAVLGRADLHGSRDCGDALDRAVADQPLFHPTAFRSELPLRARPGARIQRADRSPRRRTLREQSLQRAVRRRLRQLHAHRESAQMADRLHPQLRTGFRVHPLRRGGAVLFSRQDHDGRAQSGRRLIQRGQRVR